MDEHELDLAAAVVKMPILAGVNNLNEGILLLLGVDTERLVTRLIMRYSLFEIFDCVVAIETRVVRTLCLVLFARLVRAD